jgi:23S rRNA (adenine-N6)-dimethyltransferase
MGIYHNKNTLSQNFINNSGLVKTLLKHTDISKNDEVVEIGPGKGIITKELIDSSKNVIAVEKDPVLAKSLSSEFADQKKLKIINCNFLDFHLPQSNYKVFANIPFNITADIITRFLKSSQKPESMYYIMQKEAADKYVGIPAETQSSVLAKPWYEIAIIGDIDRSNFTPKPQIDIVFIGFKRRDNPFIKNEDRQDFRDFVIYGFNQWQPTILDAYKKIFSYNQLKMIKKSFKLEGLKPTETSFDAWLGIFKAYRNVVSEDKKNVVRGFERKYRGKIKV